MIRLTLILVAVIFAVLVLVPREAPVTEEAADTPGEGRPVRVTADDSALRETEDGRLVLVTAGGEELPIDLVVDPSGLTEEDARVNLPDAEASGALPSVEDAPPSETADPASADAEATPAEIASAPIEPGALLRVTGERVNFRAGPSTSDDILAALDLGTEVELIERVGDGWAHLRVPGTGLEGYMSEDFLAPAN
jgi:hypothetical protein